METQKINNQASLFDQAKKTTFTQKVFIAIGTCVGILIPLSLLQPTAAKGTYQPQVPDAQTQYDQRRKELTTALQNFCDEEWKGISKAKISDESNGAGKEPPRMDEWNQNLKVDCSKIEAPTGF